MAFHASVQTKRLRGYALCILLLLLAATIIVRDDSWRDLPALFFSGDGKTEVIDRTISTAGIPTLSISNNIGPVTIQHGDDDTTVLIHIVKRAATSHLLDTLDVQIVQDGDRISIHTTANGFGHTPFGGNSRSVTYDIRLPAHADITPAITYTKSSPIVVHGVAGRLDLQTEDSDITVWDYDGEVSTQTFDGEISVFRGTGPVQIRKRVAMSRPR